MEEKIITLDVGSTNTRGYLINSKGEILKTAKINKGTSLTAKFESNAEVKNAVKACIEELSDNSVKAIIASGMIGSDLGLINIPHLQAPVSAKDLAEGLSLKYFEDISPLPFYFVPGLKADSENPKECDMMRGEETEAVYLKERLAKDCVLILPGSHTKFVFIKDNKLTGCTTTITGELLALLTKETVTAGAVEHQFANTESFSKEYLLKGYELAKEIGISASLFKARILRTLFNITKEEAAWFLLGVLINGDITALLKNKSYNSNLSVLIAGKEPFLLGFKTILQEENLFLEISEAKEEPFSAKGAYILAKEKNIF